MRFREGNWAICYRGDFGKSAGIRVGTQKLVYQSPTNEAGCAKHDGMIGVAHFGWRTLMEWMFSIEGE
jgi:hypothetical protein